MNAIQAESRAYFRALGAHISLQRKEQSMTQAELARALGVSKPTVGAYESGDRHLSVLILAKLAQVFAVPVEELMGTRKAQLLAKHRPSPAGMRHAERFQQLSRTEQRFVKKIMDVLLEMNAAASAVNSK